MARISVDTIEVGALSCPRGKLLHADDEPDEPYFFTSNVFLLRHDSGRKVLFDLGCKKYNFPSGKPGIKNVIDNFNMHTERSAAEILSSKFQIAAEEIDTILYSHSHWDHTGDHEAFASAALMAGKGSLCLDYTSTESKFDTIDRLQEYEFDYKTPIYGLPAHDFFQDGTLMLLSTPGHLPGHVIALISTKSNGKVLLAGDLAHHQGVLHGNVTENSSMHRDPKLADGEIDAVRDMMKDGIQVYLAHQPQLPQKIGFGNIGAHGYTCENRFRSNVQELMLWEKFVRQFCLLWKTMTGMHTNNGGVTIKQMRTFLIEDIANPMSHYKEYKSSRSSWGIDVMGSFCVSIEASNGVQGFATGFGGSPACFLAETHFKRFLIGADPRDTNLLWDQMYRASMYYGRKGLAIAIISVIDLALWDLLGKLRKEPVYKMIGGRTKEFLSCYCTGPSPDMAKKNGFWGGKVPLPFGPSEPGSLQKNFERLRSHRESVGPDFPIMVDCYMSLNVNYAIELATRCLELHIEWWEEVLHPDDSEGYAYIKRALPQLKWTTGEHEYTRYGFRKLIEGRNIDILQPDVMWCGGLSELLKISAHSAAYDIPIVPHGSGPYSFHFVMSQTNAPFVEYVANSADGQEVLPSFGNLFLNEPVPSNGRLEISDLRGPGFGLDLNPEVRLTPFSEISNTINGPLRGQSQV